MAAGSNARRQVDVMEDILAELRLANQAPGGHPHRARTGGGAVMDRCPNCGVELEPRLVAAIRNPMAEESCPRAKRPEKPAPAPAVDPGMLRPYMIAAQIMRAGVRS